MRDFSDVSQIKPWFLKLQQTLIKKIEAADEKQKFLIDEWQYKENGGGISSILEEGQFIEKAGVNFSHIMGKQLPQAATLKRPELANSPFEAIGVSVVIHPRNPYAPTSHFNLRFISVETAEKTIWWFGGGFDLTPYYGFTEDCEHWHRCAKHACEPFGEEIYPKFKKWADDYFYLKHRNEARGIGGIFFDDLNQWDFDQCFKFIKNVADQYQKAYFPILDKRKNLAYSKRERDFQLYRRGRYVEFNLLYDRGTLFGVQSGGRTESILMSLPPLVAWKYNWIPAPNSKEEELNTKFLIPQEWL